LTYASKLIDSPIFYYGSRHQDELLNDYIVYLNKNKRIGRFVFPIKSKRDWKTHYCYLITIGNGDAATTQAIDINNAEWARIIDRRVAKVKGDNPYAWSEKMSIQYYSDHISDLNEAYNNNFK